VTNYLYGKCDLSLAVRGLAVRFKLEHEKPRGKAGRISIVFARDVEGANVRDPVAAYIRRWCVLLGSLNDWSQCHEVYLDSEALGSVAQVQLTWRLRHGGLRIQFRQGERIREFSVCSVRKVRSALEILLHDTVQPVPHMLTIIRRNGPEGVPNSPWKLWSLVRRWLQEDYPGFRTILASRRPDRAHTLSGTFLRVLFGQAGKLRVVVAAEPDGGSGDQHEPLTQAILWTGRLSGKYQPAKRPEALILVPVSSAAVLHHCAGLLDRHRFKAEVYEYACLSDKPAIRRTRNPPPPVENRDFRWPVLGPFRWSGRLSSVLDLAPQLVRRYPRFQDYDSLRLRGLEFARVYGQERDRISFGVGFQQTDLTDENFELLRMLVNEILYFRRPDSPAADHPYYRAQSERWLESLVLEEAERLFPELAPESVYSQIPVYLGKDPGRVDILGVDREGTLTVMELKVAANPNLPLQALDYWGRVVQHNLYGDFARRGYFAEVRLNRRPPKIYLVAPVFSFHDSTEQILHLFDPTVEVWKIGVNEDWRSGVRVLHRTRLRSGHEAAGHR
jgi:hypothetical protein